MVTGFAAERVEERAAELEESATAYASSSSTTTKAEEWNNAYSLWLAREAFADGILLVNGDTVHPPSVEETLLAARGDGVLLAVDQEKDLGAEEMKILACEGRGLAADQQRDRPGGRRRRVHRRGTDLKPAAAGRWPTRSRRRGGAIRRSTTRTGSRSSSTAAATSASSRSAPSTGWKSTITATSPARGSWHSSPSPHGRVPARGRHPPRGRRRARHLARATSASPRAGTSRSSSGPARATRSSRPSGPRSRTLETFAVEGGTIWAALELTDGLRAGSFDAVVGIGGGRTIDVAKYAAGLVGLPMVSVATNLAHDGIASPVASLEHDGRKGSYGVHVPIAVVVDLDYVRRSPPEQLRAGVGDALSNLSALADWELAGRERGEPVDGLAAAFSRAGAESLLHRTDDLLSDTYLTALAEALVLSGLAMAAPEAAGRAAGRAMRSPMRSTRSTQGVLRTARRSRSGLSSPRSCARTSGWASSTPRSAATAWRGCPPTSA